MNFSCQCSRCMRYRLFETSWGLYELLLKARILFLELRAVVTDYLKLISINQLETG